MIGKMVLDLGWRNFDGKDTYYLLFNDWAYGAGCPSDGEEFGGRLVSYPGSTTLFKE